MNDCDNKKQKDKIINHFLANLVSALLDEAKDIKFSKETLQEVLLSFLYARILDISLSINILLQANDCTGLPILLRSQLEAFVDFINLLEDENFAYTMEATFNNQKSRLQKNLEKITGPPEKETNDDKESKKISCEYKPLHISKRFENINLDKTYATMYLILCNYSHNNLGMLEHKHLGVNGEEFEVLLHKNEPLPEFSRLALTVGAILVDAHKKLIKFFKISPSSSAKDSCIKFLQFRRNILPSQKDH